MKIIGGKSKGGKFKTKKGLSTRPLMARVKKSLFSILGETLDGVYFLDIFAGNGGVGIEALSRGAEFCCLVDKDNKCTEIISENLENFALDTKARVMKTDVFRALKLLAEEGVKFDVIFSGPPYGTPLAEQSLQAIAKTSILKDSSVVIIETRKHDAPPEREGSLRKFREERYGDTLLTFYKQNIEDNPEKSGLA